MKVVIIGGGIAGLALGLLLKKDGIQVSIHEKDIQILSKGHGFLMHPVGYSVLQTLSSLTKDVAIPGELINKVIIKNASNNSLKSAQPGDWHCLRRSDLVQFLSSPFAAEDIKFKQQFSHFLFEGDKAIAAVFMNGDVEYGEVFIGADGAKSSVRKSIFGESKFSPVEVKEIVGTSSQKVLSTPVSQTFTKYLNTEAGVSFGYIPCSEHELVWFSQINIRLNPIEDETQNGIEKTCQKLLKDFPEDVQQILEKNDFSKNYIWNSTDFDLLPAFHKGNIQLIGDAAHLALPFTSAGTTNALVDAKIYADLISQGLPIEEVGLQFYQERAPQVSNHLAFGRKMKDIFLNPHAHDTPIPLIETT
jgi:2-polyprenyl-6-methoxyphenol hydroxylase-like FAD-dependent oxidoreductase